MLEKDTKSCRAANIRGLLCALQHLKRDGGYRKAFRCPVKLYEAKSRTGYVEFRGQGHRRATPKKEGGYRHLKAGAAVISEYEPQNSQFKKDL